MCRKMEINYPPFWSGEGQETVICKHHLICKHCHLVGVSNTTHLLLLNNFKKSIISISESSCK